jgi:hypothetical protein
VDVDLADLASFDGVLVRVGGLVVALTADGFTLDDGTATGRIVLTGSALDSLTLIEPDDALNAIGRVEARPDGPVVVVDSPGGLIVAGDPVAAASGSVTGETVAAAPIQSQSPGPAGSSRFAGLTGAPWPTDAGVAGLGSLVLVSVLSLAVTLLRRQRSQRRLAARVAVRLATLTGSSGPPPAAASAERGPSTTDSA